MLSPLLYLTKFDRCSSGRYFIALRTPLLCLTKFDRRSFGCFNVVLQWLPLLCLTKFDRCSSGRYFIALRTPLLCLTKFDRCSFGRFWLMKLSPLIPCLNRLFSDSSSIWIRNLVLDGDVEANPGPPKKPISQPRIIRQRRATSRKSYVESPPSSLESMKSELSEFDPSEATDSSTENTPPTSVESMKSKLSTFSPVESEAECIASPIILSQTQIKSNAKKIAAPAKRVGRSRRTSKIKGTGITPPAKKSTLTDLPSPSSTEFRGDSLQQIDSLVFDEFNDLSLDHLPNNCFVSFDVETLARRLLLIGKPKLKAVVIETEENSEESPDAEEEVIKEVDEPDLLKPDFEQDEIVIICCSILSSELEHLQSVSFYTAPEKTDPIAGQSCVKYFRFGSEKELLRSFIKFLYFVKPKLLIGYNCDKFDIPLVKRRCELQQVYFNYSLQIPNHVNLVSTNPLYNIGWLRRWISDCEIGPFKSLDFYKFLRQVYKFKGGRSLANVARKLFGNELQKFEILSPAELKHIGKRNDGRFTSDEWIEYKFKTLLKMISMYDNGELNFLISYCLNDVEIVSEIFRYFSFRTLQRLLELPGIKTVKCSNKVLFFNNQPVLQMANNFHLINSRGRRLLKVVLLGEYERLSENDTVIPNLTLSNEIFTSAFWVVAAEEKNILKFSTTAQVHDDGILEVESESEIQSKGKSKKNKSGQKGKKHPGGKPSNKTLDARQTVCNYYSNVYKPLLGENFDQPSAKYTPQLIKYHVRKVRSNYSNHLSRHFNEYIFRALNLCQNKKARLRSLRPDPKSLDQEEQQLLQQQRHDLINQFQAARDNIIEYNLVDSVFSTFDCSKYPSLCEAFKYYLKTFYKSTQHGKGKNAKNLMYSQKVNPLGRNLLAHVIHLCRIIQRVERPDTKRPLTVPNCFPLARSSIPGYFPMDTLSASELLLDVKKINQIMKNKDNQWEDKTMRFFTRWLGTYQSEMWDTIINKNARCFKTTNKSYSFNNYLLTDGYASSVILLRNDLVGKDYTTVQVEHAERYVNDLSEEEIIEHNYRSKRFVGIDPNQYDVISAVSKKTDEELIKEGISIDQLENVEKDSTIRRPRKTPIKRILNKKNPKNKELRLKAKQEGKSVNDYFKNSEDYYKYQPKLRKKDEWNQFRYTQGERNWDKKPKFVHHSKQCLTVLPQFSEFKANNETASDQEAVDYVQKFYENDSELSARVDDLTTTFAKRCILNEERNCFLSRFLTYVEQKEIYDLSTRNHYYHPVFRKRRFERYMNDKRGEDQFINRFKTTFGAPSDVLIGYGDWSHESGRRKGKISTIKGKALRSILRKSGYNILMVNEYRTSKCCSSCVRNGIQGINSHDNLFHEKNNEKKTIQYKDPNFIRKQNKLKERIRLKAMEEDVDFDVAWEKFKKEFPKKVEQKQVKPWGLVRCNACNTLWNRDLNSAINIYEILKSEIEGHGRPVMLQKQEKDDEVVEQASKETDVAAEVWTDELEELDLEL
ncbi:hypothetical protein RCL1_002659 [Eukaryota sp. TZLM3-RCL]